MNGSLMFKYSRLILGITFCAFGMVMIKNSNIGFAPWQVLHSGMGKSLGITMGEASIITGAIMVFIAMLFKESIGLGTVIKVVLLGYLMDVFTFNGMIPIQETFPKGLTCMLLGIFVNAMGLYLYIGSGLGPGIRDGFIAGLARKTHKSKYFVKNTIEVIIVIIGYTLDGFLGVGTAISAILIGKITTLTFKFLRFNKEEIYHTYFKDEVSFIYSTVFCDDSSVKEECYFRNELI